MENSSVDTTPKNESVGENLHKMDLYWKIGYNFSFFLIIVSVATIVANGLLLLVLYKDPLRRFRTPLCNILVSLSATDLLAAFTYEPVSASCFIMAYFNNPSTKTCLYYVQNYLSAVTRTIWKMSPLHIFALTILQFLVVALPLKLARNITNNYTIAVSVFIWVYSTVFEIIESTLPKNSRVFFNMTLTDIIIHNLCIPSLTLFVYILLYREFKRRSAQGFVIRSASQEQASKEKRRLHCQQKLLKINLLLIVILFLCTLPYGWIQLFYLRFNLRVFEFQFIPIATFSLKMMLHTIVFAWRLPHYRKAFTMVWSSKSKVTFRNA